MCLSSINLVEKKVRFSSLRTPTHELIPFEKEVLEHMAYPLSKNVTHVIDGGGDWWLGSRVGQVVFEGEAGLHEIMPRLVFHFIHYNTKSMYYRYGQYKVGRLAVYEVNHEYSLFRTKSLRPKITPQLRPLHC